MRLGARMFRLRWRLRRKRRGWRCSARGCAAHMGERHARFERGARYGEIFLNFCRIGLSSICLDLQVEHK